VRTKCRLYSAVLAIVVVGVLTSAPTAAAADGKGKRVLRIVATENQFQFLDLGTAGPSLGDELVFSERLTRRGRPVGVSGGVCTATQVEPPYDELTFHCVATLKLRRGQITLQGLIEVQGEDDPGPFTVAITGGTGRYSGAGGKAVIREVSPTKSVYKLHFTSRKKHNGK
jgi:allene oxide cyclase-like protein